jgi:hypothetical protein
MKLRLIIAAVVLIGIPANNFAQKNEITAKELSEWAHFLASDDMKGRANGSPEMKLAADYIAGKFGEFGLKPLPGLEGFIQEYTFSSRRNGEIAERNVIGYLEGNDPELKDEFLL